MPALLELQRAFSRALLSGDAQEVGRHIAEDGFSAAERLRIYGNTCRSTLIETLRMTYPAVDRLVGGAFFDGAAGSFGERHPPRSACLNDYGSGFDDFLSGLDAAKDVPYLADVARFEWALSVAAHAEDAPFLEAGALRSVPPEHHGALCFAGHPSVSFLELAFPADQIADAVLSGDAAAMEEVDISSGPVCLVVHRGRSGLEAQRLQPAAYRFAARLCAGEPLAALIESAAADAPALVAEQLAKGRLTTFKILR